jgi:hemolysin D
MKPSSNVVALRRKQRDAGRRDELAFLPAALEVVETPPSPVGRGIGATIIVMFGAALAWACLGEVDVVATAPGKIIPTGHTKIVQPLDSGVVRAIHVQDGQTVKAGDLLIELDPTMSGAELERHKGDRIAAQLDVARLRTALVRQEDPLAVLPVPEGATAAQVEVHRRLLVSRASEQNSKLAAIDRQQAQRQAERSTVAAMIGKLEAAIPLLEERVNVRKHLSDRELGSRLLYLTELQDLTNQQQELLVQRSRYQEANAAILATAEARRKAAAEYQHALLDELSKAEQKVAALSQDVIKAQQKAKLQRLMAPVDGVVQQLGVHTVGGVVTPAQDLLVIVPVDSRLEIEAMVPNRDVGFIGPGQDAEIKVDTFNFARYGLLRGKVLSVSRDAIARNRLPDKGGDRSRAADAGNSEPTGQELSYTARVSLDRERVQVEDRAVNLSPGMTVTVEIKTGSRRVISYLLSPLVRYRQEVLRER